MNKIFLSSILSFASLTVSAQGTYDAANLMQKDLIGSARYVGMGGALNALGADISLMGSNPAGTGLYRKSDVGFTLAGLVTGQPGQLGHSRERISLDEAGVLFAFQVDNSGSGIQYVNFGVNYKKNRNFFGNNEVAVQHLDKTFSQTFQIAYLAERNRLEQPDHWGMLADLSTRDYDQRGALLKEGIIDHEEGEPYFGVAAKEAFYCRSTSGSNIEADINVSLNASDRFYYGLSFGIYNVDYSRNSFYQEVGTDGNYYDFTNWYRTTGTGFDMKFGVICRPVEDSPFRLGLAIHTPTWYRLTDANGAILYYNNENVYSPSSNNPNDGLDSGDYDYKLRSPWKFNLSAGHTIGNFIAIGAEYEYESIKSAKYSPVEYSYREREYLDGINNQIGTTLRGQHTFKLGVEYKPAEPLSLRLGYNFISSIYNINGYKDIMYFEPFTETDYTNWGATNRISLGVGYRWRTGYVDAAYQFQTQKGDFYAFDDPDFRATRISNSRSNFMATLGFRF